MTVKTEGKHTEEFLLREGNGDISREKATLTNGQTVVDGQVVKLTASKLVAATGAHDTAGVSTETTIVGIVCGNWTATADIPNVPYIARLATVKDSAMTYYTGGFDAVKKAAVIAVLAAKNIISR